MIRVRTARVDDSAGLARVQVDSYRATYAGILPDDYVANFSYSEQEQDWRDWHTLHPQDILLVAESDDGEIVAYALGRPGLTNVAPYDGELAALHVRQRRQRQGIGRQLVAKMAQQLERQGCSSLMLWVLDRNPSRLFYERLGGRLIGEQTIELGQDVTAVEVAYGWPDIKSLCGVFDKASAP